MLRLLAGLGRDSGPHEREHAAAALRAIGYELHSPEGGGGCSDEEEDDAVSNAYSFLPDSDEEEGEADADDEAYGEGEADYRKNFEMYLASQHGIQPSNQIHGYYDDDEEGYT